MRNLQSITLINIDAAHSKFVTPYQGGHNLSVTQAIVYLAVTGIEIQSLVGLLDMQFTQVAI